MVSKILNSKFPLGAQCPRLPPLKSPAYQYLYICQEAHFNLVVHFFSIYYQSACAYRYLSVPRNIAMYSFHHLQQARLPSIFAHLLQTDDNAANTGLKNNNINCTQNYFTMDSFILFMTIMVFIGLTNSLYSFIIFVNNCFLFAFYLFRYFLGKITLYPRLVISQHVNVRMYLNATHSVMIEFRFNFT